MKLKLHPASEQPNENRVVYFLAMPDDEGEFFFTSDTQTFRTFKNLGISAAKNWDEYLVCLGAENIRVIGWEYEHVLLGEPEPECSDCDGLGYWEKGLRGTRIECDTCHGSGLANRPAEVGSFTSSQIDAAMNQVIGQ